MANINLPVPVAVAGGCLCLLGGYLIGAVAGPQASDPTVATVSRVKRKPCQTETPSVSE